MIKYLGILVILFILGHELKAQTIPVGMPVLEDGYRNLQLLGKLDSTTSFCARPLFPVMAFKVKDGFDPYNSLHRDSTVNAKKIYRFENGKGFIQFLPVSWINQLNTDRPAGMNDGAMIPARGYQTQYNRGIYFQYKHLSIQLKPEIIYAENSNYQGFPHTLYDPVLADQRWYQYYHSFLNKIDLPERFGSKDFSKAFLGQSSIRLNYGAVSFGISTENLWWGPGIYNSLLMTNSAPGFAHITLNTVKPLKTTIGSVEGQIIAGKLTHSGFTPPESDRRYFQTLLYIPKPDDWRYLNGLVVSYQPKWVPGLFLGITRSFMKYEKEIGNLKTFNIGDILPVFSPFAKKNAVRNKDNTNNRDQYESLFMRWVWLKAHGEVYVEYGRRDYFWDTRDLTLEPSHTGAYLFGLRKLVPLKSHQEEYMELNLELTQLEMNVDTRIRNGKSWYLGDEPGDGYTNQGQLLGAGIGPGSNIQTLNVSWMRSLKKIGIVFNRYMHNSDFFYTYVKDLRSHWIDFSEAVVANWDYKNLLFNVRIEAFQTMNQGWSYTPPTPPTFWVPGKDSYNYHFQLGVTYRF